jgi:acetylglutamate kinase
MIPKIETAIEAVEAGCTGAAIVDGRVQHCVLRELTSGSSGTLVTAE